MPRPDIHLYTAATMNGYKPVIFLEEAGVPYDLTFIDFSKQEQKAPEYLKLNPNGKIPTIVDRSEGRAIFESGAILWHLAEKYGKFLSDDPMTRSETLQWLFFQVGHVGPMMGQAMYFQRIAAPNGHEEPFSIKRYVAESRRLMEVLNARLEGRDHIVGAYSIADMMIYPWARAYPWAGVEVDDLPHLAAWFDRIDARPAVRKALTIPKAQPQFWDAAADADAFVQENAARFASDVRGS
ncbi:glutathione S-transferase family protein [Tropicimonas sediminicola]|uniref:GST-like protein n=1 Tax=Tropicimonas sediminicola TaxID=1031541 RepID=A0A239LA80_9RHOB|nr:glutathione S-transferase N-terminal domain-containing protein [Tropicimonas sediminicola]SNT26569.1 GST-like protein [Tropicimonas sediminicola]